MKTNRKPAARAARSSKPSQERPELDVQLVRELNRKYTIEVERFDARPEVYESGATRVGFVYLTLSDRALDIKMWSARGVKIWLSADNQISLQFREEEGTDGTYRPYFFLRNRELRALITLMVQRDQDVVAGVAAAAKLRAEQNEPASAPESEDAELENLIAGLAGASTDEPELEDNELNF